MTNFLEMTTQHHERVGHYAARLHRVEIHVKRGEKRAARAQLQGMLYELQMAERELELPLEFILAGANLGFFSGKGNLVRGRLVAGLLGASFGWLMGQASVIDIKRDVRELMIWTLRLEEALLLLESDV